MENFFLLYVERHPMESWLCSTFRFAPNHQRWYAKMEAQLEYTVHFAYTILHADAHQQNFCIWSCQKFIKSELLVLGMQCSTPTFCEELGPLIRTTWQTSQVLVRRTTLCGGGWWWWWDDAVCWQRKKGNQTCSWTDQTLDTKLSFGSSLVGRRAPGCWRERGRSQTQEV